MKPIAPNTLLQNRYLIVHLIGKGGMGEVYLAVDQRLGSAVALKRTFFSDDEMLGTAFEREARTLARLRHNVLPKVSDHFTEDSNQYLIMEHISGEDLSKRLETTNKPFPLSWVLFWADQLLDALNYIHSNEPPIIHRDIKPQNLKLTDENSIILLDFGLSKNSVDLSRVSSTGSVVGYTPHYAPMEQIRGTGTDGRSDLYSLSATLYQLLTNTVPTDALTRADSLLSGMSDPLKPINEINPQVTPLIAQVIARGMEVGQDRRFPNARQMQKALRDAFAQMQNEPAAAQAAQSAPLPEILQSQLKTEIISLPKAEPKVDLKSSTTKVKPKKASAVADAISETNGSASSPLHQSESQPVDFDATLAYDPKPEEHTVKPSDVQTEVLLAGSTPEITAIQQEYYQSKTAEREVKEEFNADEDFSDIDSSERAENFSPDATMPVISYNEGISAKSRAKEDLEFDDNAAAGKNVESFAISTPTTQYSREDLKLSEIEDDSARENNAAISTPIVNKKSGGKAIFIVGGLGALLLVMTALGAGLYFYASSSPVTKSTPIPTPEATVEISATPLPTVEAVINTEVNSNSSTSDVSDSEISNVNSNTSSNEKSAEKPVENNLQNPTAGKQPQPTPVKANPKPTAQTVAPPKPVVKPTAAKATPLPRILP